MKILSLAPLAGPGLEKLRSLGDLEVDPWDSHVPIRMTAGPDLVTRLEGVDVLIVEPDPVFGDIFEQLFASVSFNVNQPRARFERFKCFPQRGKQQIIDSNTMDARTMRGRGRVQECLRLT